MTETGSPRRVDRLRTVLAARFAPTVLEIHDDSARHAGHAGAAPGGQTHFTVLVVSSRFAGLSRIARARAVHEALAQEFGPPESGGMHALSLILRTPEEQDRQR